MDSARRSIPARCLVFFESSQRHEAPRWQGAFEEPAQAIGIAEHGTAGRNAVQRGWIVGLATNEKNTSHLEGRTDRRVATEVAIKCTTNIGRLIVVAIGFRAIANKAKA